MKKLLLTTSLILSTSATAQATGQMDDMCNGTEISVSNQYTGVTASYVIAANFPQPSKTVQVKSPFTIQCPNFSAKADGNMAEVKAKDFATLIELTGIGSKGNKFIALDIAGISGYKYPTISEGFYYFGLGFYLKDNGLTELSNFSSAPTTGFRIDDGELKPWFFDGKTNKTGFVMGTNKKIEFYAMPSSSTYYEKISIDFTNNTLSVWEKFTFPSK